MMKRYKITDSFRKEIKKSKSHLKGLKLKKGIDLKNILNKNKSIGGDDLENLEIMLNKKFPLKEIKINPSGNLGKYSNTKPIRRFRKSSDLAEFIGIMLGDGNLWENRVKIAFNKNDLRYIGYVRNLFEKIFGILPRIEHSKKLNGSFLVCNNKILTNKLLALGLKRGNKINNSIIIPRWIKENKNYSKRCIKGLIDTDGCIYFCKRDKKVYLKFTSFNLKLLNDFKSISKRLGYNFVKANKNNVALYRKEEVAKFIKEIKPLKSEGMWGSLVSL